MSQLISLPPKRSFNRLFSKACGNTVKTTAKCLTYLMLQDSGNKRLSWNCETKIHRLLTAPTHSLTPTPDRDGRGVEGGQRGRDD